MSKIEVNTVAPQCGTTLTLGENDDTVVLGTGAAFGGGVGAVKWETTPQTGSFGAVAGRGYFMNTTSGPLTLTLPATPSAGDIVAVSDYAQNSNTNNITLARNGSNIQGDASDLVIQRNGIAMTLVFVDATKGWIVTDTGAESDKDPIPTFITASGGTVTCCGNYKIHTFTGPGTFTVNSVGNPAGSTTIDYLVVAGGGSGGNGFVNNNCGPGGGGAGGFRESCGGASGCYTTSPLANPCGALPITIQGYPITVGAGASAAGPGLCAPSSQGSNSIFSTITSTGGGKGGNGTPPAAPIPIAIGGDGGSGGGGARITDPTSGGNGNTPPVSPPQGNPGGTGSPGAGGGGATAAGTGGVDCASVGNGGAGATTSISGSSTAYAGGGGSGHTCGEPAGGTGGTGGGGPGGAHGATAGCAACTQGTPGTANTGGGGGGQGGAAGVETPATSGAGGSGIVIIRYKFQ